MFPTPAPSQSEYGPVNLDQWKMPFSISVIHVQIRSAVVLSKKVLGSNPPWCSELFVWSFYVLSHSVLELTLGVNLSVNGCPTACWKCNPPRTEAAGIGPAPVTTLKHKIPQVKMKRKWNEKSKCSKCDWSCMDDPQLTPRAQIK